jgi:hypothetical protein
VAKFTLPYSRLDRPKLHDGRDIVRASCTSGLGTKHGAAAAEYVPQSARETARRGRGRRTRPPLTCAHLARGATWDRSLLLAGEEVSRELGYSASMPAGLAEWLTTADQRFTYCQIAPARLL